MLVDRNPNFPSRPFDSNTTLGLHNNDLVVAACLRGNGNGIFHELFVSQIGHELAYIHFWSTEEGTDCYLYRKEILLWG